jgi:hypothetical protein
MSRTRDVLCGSLGGLAQAIGLRALYFQHLRVAGPTLAKERVRKSTA